MTESTFPFKFIFRLLLVVFLSTGLASVTASGQDLEDDIPVPDMPESIDSTGPHEMWDVTTKAEFSAGDTSIATFIAHNVVYPREAVESGIEGRILLEFVVETDGSINPELVKVLSKPVGYGLEEEAIRVILLTSGKWAPAAQRDRNVRMRYRIPISFKLQ